MYIKNSDISGIALDEIEGTVQGHRDGHGFVVRDDGEPDIYLPPNEMRAVLHRDRVKVRIVRQDRRGRPEGRVLEIAERPPHPIIGRLLHERTVERTRRCKDNGPSPFVRPKALCPVDRIA